MCRLFLNVLVEVLYLSHSNTPLMNVKNEVTNVIQRGSKRWTRFRTSIFPELYMACE